MGKRILVFADGTGNEGGLLPDESRTNVYKLYRATRTGPDSIVDPHEQLAFYVPGVGTSLPGHAGRFHGAKETFQQAVGEGLKNRIRACYKAIIGTWRPGDSIYLFGFSRGAYTARCVAHLLEVFGIPSLEPGAETLSLDPKRLEIVAKRAVNSMYRFGFLIKNSPERQRKVARFVENYRPHLGAATGATPYFLGLWDSVAADGLGQLFPKRYDPHLPPEIRYVRHALSIDENRRDFARVIFGGSHTIRQPEPGEPEPFEQVWFAGNHSDIGGSYPENESLLSDISLKWILDFVANEVPRAIHRGSLRTLAKRDGINQKTVAKWCTTVKANGRSHRRSWASAAARPRGRECPFRSPNRPKRPFCFRPAASISRP